jgi:hypothetical protein
VACLLLSAATVARSAARGDLDPGFGRNGRVNLKLDAGLDVYRGRSRGFVSGTTLPGEIITESDSCPLECQTVLQEFVVTIP